MSLDSKALETRVLQQIDEVIPSTPSWVRLGRMLKDFKDKTGDPVALENFQREIFLIGLDLERTVSSYRAMEEDITSYRTRETDFENEVQGTRNNIQKLEIELQQQQKIRKQREVLEEIAKTVNSRTSRTLLKRKIASVEEELKGITDSIALTDTRIQARAKQFGALLQCISDLQGKLVEEEEPVLQAAVSGAGDGDEEVTDTGRDDRDREEETEEAAEVDIQTDAQTDVVEGEGGDVDETVEVSNETTAEEVDNADEVVAVADVVDVVGTSGSGGGMDVVGEADSNAAAVAIDKSISGTINSSSVEHETGTVTGTAAALTVTIKEEMLSAAGANSTEEDAEEALMAVVDESVPI
jgi:hypothetical protein